MGWFSKAADDGEDDPLSEWWLGGGKHAAGPLGKADGKLLGGGYVGKHRGQDAPKGKGK
jgi:hypothetical protein